jgi:hypothetical protein
VSPTRSGAAPSTKPSDSSHTLLPSNISGGAAFKHARPRTPCGRRYRSPTRGSSPPNTRICSAQLVATADDAARRRLVAYRNSQGIDFTSTVGDIVTHTALHGVHHRGQILRILRAAGHEPPYIDYIQFTRLDQLA